MKPFNEGQRDFKVGQLVNPYNVNTTRNREWERGFNKAYFDNLDQIEGRKGTDGNKKKKNKNLGGRGKGIYRKKQ